MLTLCDLAIVKPLSIIFKIVLIKVRFQIYGRNRIYAPFIRKETNNNYRPVFLLPICGKIFERLIFNSLFQYLEEHNLLSAHHSAFRADDSCVNQLLSIVHDICTAFDAYPTLESCGVFGYVKGF